MSTPTPQEWRERVGRHVEARRFALQVKSIRNAAAQAGVSESVWRQIESGKRQVRPGEWDAPSPSNSTASLITLALGWVPDAFERLLAGEPPESVVDPGTRSDELWSTSVLRMTPDPPIEVRLEDIERRVRAIEAQLKALKPASEERHLRAAESGIDPGAAPTSSLRPPLGSTPIEGDDA